MAKKIGRPKSKVDKEMFEKLCGLHCTLIEISGFMGISDDTIERWCKREYKKPFAEINKLKRGKGAVSLRRKQFEIAMSGNPTLLIWLGKQYLNQTEKNETFERDKPFELSYLPKSKRKNGSEPESK